ATPGWEKQEVERLLRDAQRHKFDAVIVASADRWSRDNADSKRGLDILAKNDIRFFVGTTEFNLFLPEHKFFLGMSAEIGEFQANNQSRKSLLNKIERAKKGVPVTGQLPSGRTYDKKTGKWDINKEFKEKIEEAAQRYIAGESMAQLAIELGIK